MDLPLEESLFFAGRPEELALYEVLRARVAGRVGAFRVKVSKTQITFAVRYGFAFVSHPRRKQDRGILVTFGLSHRQVSDRIQYASEPYPHRWTHHMLVGSEAEIDGELLDWIEEACGFSQIKGR